MTPWRDAALRATAPHVFPIPLLNDEPIRCGDGWFDLLCACFTKLDALIAKEPPARQLEYAAMQVKEKFGGLRVYLTWASTEMTECIDIAEQLAEKTCDVCGLPGSRRSGAGVSYPFWIRTRCDEHVDWREQETGFAHGSGKEP